LANIATLAVSLIANTENFEKGMKGAAAQMSITGRATDMLSTSIAAIGWTGAVAGLSAWVSAQMQAIDASAKLSDQIGSSIGQINSFRLAVDLAGGSGADADSALTFLSKKIGQAQQGSKDATADFQRLGLSVEELAAAGAAGSIEMISNAIASLGTQTEKAAAVTDLFGKSNAGLVTVLQEGSAELERAAIITDLVGKNISKIEAQPIVEANDRWTEFKNAIDGIGASLTVLLAPAINTVAKFLAGMAMAVAGVLKLYREYKEWIDIIISPMTAYIDTIMNYVTWTDASAESEQAAIAAIDEKTGSLVKLEKTLKDVNKEAAEMARLFNERGKSDVTQFNQGISPVAQLANREAAERAKREQENIDAIKREGQAEEERIRSTLAKEEEKQRKLLEQQEAIDRRALESVRNQEEAQKFALGLAKGSKTDQGLAGEVRQIDPSLLAGVQSMAKTESKEVEDKKAHAIAETIKAQLEATNLFLRIGMGLG